MGESVTWSKSERRLLDAIASIETALQRGRAIDRSSFEELLQEIDKYLVSSRQDLFVASARGDGEACRVKCDLQNKANVARAQLIASQGNVVR